MNHSKKKVILFNASGYSIFRISACVAGAFFMLSMSGCATILKGKHQTIPVASNPTNADVILDGQLYGQTPIDLEVIRKRDHLVTIEKAGFQSRSLPITKKVGGAVWGNILLGGLIGWGVDAGTGAQFNLRPEFINVKLEALSGQATADEGKKSGAEFVAKLNQLDDLVESKTLSKDNYLKERCKLFTDYFPDSPPDDSCADGEESKGQSIASNHDPLSRSDAATSLASQLIVTSRTPDTIDPVVVQQIDGKTITQAQSGLVSALESYDVEPGVHEIIVAPRSDPDNGESVTIDVKPGVKYYLGWHESEPAIWKEEKN